MPDDSLGDKLGRQVKNLKGGLKDVAQCIAMSDDGKAYGFSEASAKADKHALIKVPLFSMERIVSAHLGACATANVSAPRNPRALSRNAENLSRPLEAVPDNTALYIVSIQPQARESLLPMLIEEALALGF